MTKDDLRKALKLAQWAIKFDDFSCQNSIESALCHFNTHHEAGFDAAGDVARALLYYTQPRPIEEAPKGKYVYGFLFEDENQPIYSDGNRWRSAVTDKFVIPTHFTPLPPEPWSHSDE